MSFIDDVVDFAGGAIGWITGNSVGATLAKTAALGFIVNQTTKNLNSSNSKSAAATTAAPDRGARLQVTPDTNHKIPVVYGTAYLGGIVTDAQLANDNKTMWYCITISEKTGATDIGRGADSEFIFEDIFWNDNRIVFKSDGITANYIVDRDGNVDYSVQDLVKIYCYAGDSDTPVVPDNYTPGPLTAAYTHMPGWTSSHTMDDLIFVIVRVDYNRDRGITGIPTITFQLSNTMNQPGDCVYDYMTNTRYGAGISPTEIYGYE